MVRRVIMMLFIMFMLASVAWAGELRQVSEAPEGKDYFDDTYSIGSNYNERLSLSNALTGVQYINDWLKNFQELTKLTLNRVSPEEKQQIGNLGIEMQTIGFYNWPKTVEGTLRKQQYEIRKLEYELALALSASGKVSQVEVAEKEKKYQEAQCDIQKFLAKFHIAD